MTDKVYNNKKQFINTRLKCDLLKIIPMVMKKLISI